MSGLSSGSGPSGLRPGAGARPVTAAPGEGRAVRFATYLAAALRPFYEAVVADVGRRTGRVTTLEVGTSFDQFAAGEIDAGFL